MHYRIDYSTPRIKARKGCTLLRLPVLTLLSFLLFLYLVTALWPEGAEYLLTSVHDLRARTAAALNHLEDAVLERNLPAAVFSDFFRTLWP